MITRHYLDVNGRRVHYRRAGKGPPVVMLHASPANSEMVLGEMAAAAPYFTCFALETPGFGESDALPPENLKVADLAGATAAAMEALGLPPCPVFGTHTGALIAVELGAGWPERVTGLVLEGLPIFNDDEIANLFKDFYVTFPPDPLGGHLTDTWMRFRDQFTWFPWPSRTVARLNPIDRPTPEAIQHWVMMYYRASRKYMPAYVAVLNHGYAARDAAAKLTVPALIAASKTDMLYEHMKRLPPLKAGQSWDRFPEDIDAKHSAIVHALRQIPVSKVEIPLAVKFAGTDPAVGYVDTPDGQVFVRCYGDTTKPALFLLHDAPGTGLALEDMARSLAGGYYVVLPDLPGTGESDNPAPDRSVLSAAADALPIITDALGVTRFTIAAIGCGCAVAAVFAAKGDPRLIALLLEDVPVPDEAIAASIAPEIPLSPEGAHWIQAWLMVRDGQIYKPWFDGRVAAQRHTQGNFNAQWLHDQTFALMKSRTSYYRLPREAYRYDCAAALAKATVPVKIAPSDGLAALILSTGGNP
jgi:pimeloyl-ACP methyl ester carboxylesterase